MRCLVPFGVLLLLLVLVGSIVRGLEDRPMCPAGFTLGDQPGLELLPPNSLGIDVPFGLLE